MNVVVTTSGGNGTLNNGYNYTTTPTVTAIAPNSGPTIGGTTVTITGTDFVSGATVTIGGNAAANVVFASATSLTAITPAGTAGANSVVVTNPDTKSSNTNITFTYTGGGGGGGGGTTAPTTVPGVTDVTSSVNTKGVFSQDVNASSNDNNLLLHIAAGTTGLISSGASLTQISIIYVSTPPTFLAGAGTVTPIYDLLPSGTTFNPPVTIRFSYNPTLIPASVAETSLQIAYYDSTVTSWITLTSKVDDVNHFISAQITHFTPYAVTYGVKAVTPTPNELTTTTTLTTTTSVATTTRPSSTTTTALPLLTTTPVVTPRPALFEATSLIINPDKVKPDEYVNVYLKITNTGDITGTDNIVLRINNLIVESKDVTLDGGDSTIVTFTTSSKLTGKYTVDIAGLNGNFTVSKSVIPGWLWPSAIGAFTLGIILAVCFAFFRKGKT